ncbi:MAG: hypothetical protein R2798_04450 [Chitinophagales bacterium]|nr:CcoQ/FixQ family Cbb3-type cytochrome c oxidase assembly chaperone [Bacteroidota bacterium]MCB9044302.1 CcoQ/FixQ family Cbb3-type cytochrome c oxidase assembly chaperone [Chitinophagales bacterium]
MYKEVLRSIDGVDFYANFSLLVFIIFFVVLFIWTMRSSKKFMDKMSEMPLQDGSIQNEKDSI